MNKDEWVHKLEQLETLLKQKARERWSFAERREIEERGELNADFYLVWDKLCIVWNMKTWLEKYGYLTYNQKIMIKQFKKEAI